jgi:hypothetical protein
LTLDIARRSRTQPETITRAPATRTSMTDDDFNRFIGGEANKKHFAIIFLICILMCCLLVWSIAAV